MSERTDKALSDYAAAQAASYIKEYCDAQKKCENCIFYDAADIELQTCYLQTKDPYEWKV